MGCLGGEDALKTRLLRLLEQPSCVYLGVTAQRDLSVLNIDPPMTKARLLRHMGAYVSRRGIATERMDSGEEAFVWKYIELEAVDGSSVSLYVKAKFGADRETLRIFSAHPDRRW